MALGHRIKEENPKMAARKKKAKKKAAKRKTGRKKVTKRRVAKKKPARRKKAAKKKPARKKKVAKRKPARKKATSKRKPSAAFMKPVTPSAALAEVIGAKPLPRTQVTKKLWLYIKKRKLQDTVNRRVIVADASLKRVFGGKGRVDMFQMTKLVSRHLS